MDIENFITKYKEETTKEKALILECSDCFHLIVNTKILKKLPELSNNSKLMNMKKNFNLHVSISKGYIQSAESALIQSIPENTNKELLEPIRVQFMKVVSEKFPMTVSSIKDEALEEILVLLLPNDYEELKELSSINDLDEFSKNYLIHNVNLIFNKINKEILVSANINNLSTSELPYLYEMTGDEEYKKEIEKRLKKCKVEKDEIERYIEREIKHSENHSRINKYPVLKGLKNAKLVRGVPQFLVDKKINMNDYLFSEIVKIEREIESGSNNDLKTDWLIAELEKELESLGWSKKSIEKFVKNEKKYF